MNHSRSTLLTDRKPDELDVHGKMLLQETHKRIEAAIGPFLQESNARIARHGFQQGSMTFDLPQHEVSPTIEKIGSDGGFGGQGSSFSQPLEVFCPPIRNRRSHNDFNGQSTNSGCSSAMKIGLFLLELSRLGLWPLSDKVMTASGQAVLGKASQFEGLGEPLSGSRCRTCKVSFKELMTKLAVEQLSKVTTGLCLGCVRAGRLMPDGGNCQNKEFCVVNEVETVA